eukprot:jgi/Psemu1/69167/estExt_Genemark1.C_7400019
MATDAPRPPVPTDVEYDYIVVGLGYAGAIMTARLAERNKDKENVKILAIEYGGPMQTKTGGATGTTADITMMATQFQAEGMKEDNSKMSQETTTTSPSAQYFALDGYTLPEFGACWQGVGLGGNGLYNGALYQEPANWWWDDAKNDESAVAGYNDNVHTDIFLTEAQKAAGVKVSDVMKPYFERVNKELKEGIKPTPSMDGVHYNHGLYDLLKPILIKNKFGEVDYTKFTALQMAQLEVTVKEEVGDRFFAVPAVNVKDGLRTGPSAWLEKFMTGDGNVKEEFPNLYVSMYTEVTDVMLNDSNTVTGVNVVTDVVNAARGGRFRPPEPVKKTFNVKPGGKVILCCNALPTTRILYLSGVGPEALRKTVVPKSQKAFKVNNEGIGTTIHEHVTTSLGFKYTGEEKAQPNTIHFDPGDYNGNAEWLRKYSRERSGPYCQFGPVVASHFRADTERAKGLPEEYQKVLNDGFVTTELFYNPFGAGWPYPPIHQRSLNPYNGPGTFTVYVMLLRPEQRGIFRLKDDEKQSAEYVDIYMNPGIPDWEKTEHFKKGWETLGLPNYRELAKRDIATMTSSVHEVIEITTSDDIELILGPGDKNTHLGTSIENTNISDLDPKNIDHVREYCTTWDDWSYVNGTRLAITRLQENHYHSAVPLSRNLDVFGNELSEEKKKTYGLNPDNCEVKGTNGLCVVDAGMFPKVVYCHPIGSVMAIAEWAADKICPE